jgi:hypothetical protein
MPKKNAAIQLSFVSDDPWIICPKCHGEKTGGPSNFREGGCDRCMGCGVVPAPGAPEWIKRIMKQNQVYEAALAEIANAGKGEINEGFIRVWHRDLIIIAEKALEK